MLLLDKVTSVSLAWRPEFRPWLTTIPVGLFLATMGTLVLIGDYWEYNDLFATVGLSLATAALALVVLPRRSLRVTSEGDILRVCIPRRHLAQTQRFVQHLEATVGAGPEPLAGPLEGTADASR